jgi:hypothetical protein
MRADTQHLNDGSRACTFLHASPPLQKGDAWYLQLSHDFPVAEPLQSKGESERVRLRLGSIRGVKLVRGGVSGAVKIPSWTKVRHI